jgi:hypothetical protein
MKMIWWRSIYGTTIFLSAFLLFLIEPIAAKQLLPVLGGSSAVWVTCLVFFQATLLLGYLYAHWLTRAGGGRWRCYLHPAMLVLCLLVLALPARRLGFNGGTANPVVTIFRSLAARIGIPFLILGSTSPLLQIWLALSEVRGINYRLFALSNAGSLLALVAYPFLIEPFFSLRSQTLAWSAGFVVFAGLSLPLWLRARVDEDGLAVAELQSGADEPPSSAWTRCLWFLLPMGAAMQLSAVTSHLTVNVAAIPLLWMLPLAAYLISFIVAFEAPKMYRRGVAVRLLVLTLASLGYALSNTDVSLPIGLGILFFLAECFVACLFCHCEVYALRPRRTSESTLFYLMIASGGVAGAFLIGIASPLIFAANYDLPLCFLVMALLALAATWSDGWSQRVLWSMGSVLLVVLVVMLHLAYQHEAMLQVRSFYGALRVKQSYAAPQASAMRMLLNGTIQHGTQWFAPGLSNVPTTYYAENSGVGVALRLCCGNRPRRVGVIGLGAGTIAAYGRPGDRFRFYEINPQVEPIAQNLFTYLRDSRAEISFAVGDARTSLQGEGAQNFDVLVVDAFSGDAIPLHLLTTEAMAIYERQLTAGGVLAFHVSNQYLNLAPEIALLAGTAGMRAVQVESREDQTRGAYRATWVLVSKDDAFFARPEVLSVAMPIRAVLGLQTWTDDYSSVLPVLQW